MSSEPELQEPVLLRGSSDAARLKKESHRCDVLVLGASFTGVEVLLQLQRRLPRPLKMVVVDRQRRHGYIPLVHERLCGRLPPDRAELDTAAFVGSLPGVEFWQDEVIAFEPEQKLAILDSGRTIAGRFVVVALGSVLEPPPLLRGAESLTTYKDTVGFRSTRERLAAVLSIEVRGAGGGGKEPPRLVVVGGGISGVELAGELAHLRRQRPTGWVAPAVTLVAAGDRLLPELSRGVGRKAAAALRAQGVELRQGTRLVEAEPGAVVLRQGDQTERLRCALALWAGGIQPAPVLSELGLPRTNDGWLAVGPTLQCFPVLIPPPLRTGPPDIFAGGDAVRVFGGTGRWPTMQRAIECLWQAKVLARNIATLAEHAPDYPQGFPPLHPHVLRERFAYGVSLGARSLVVYGPTRVDLPGVNTWFRRWLMRQYFDRYAPRSE